MFVGMLCIIGSYGLAVALVHACHSFFRWERKQPVTYLLITRNNELQLEWYLRSLLVLSWVKGRKIRVKVLDEGSTDDTCGIALKLASVRPEEIQVLPLEHADQLEDIIARHEREEAVMVRITNQRELQNIPLFQ